MKRYLISLITVALLVLAAGCAVEEAPGNDSVAPAPLVTEGVSEVPTDWVETAFAMVRDLETTSSPAFTKRDDPQVVDEWSAWADEFEAERRTAQLECQSASRDGSLSDQEEAACEAIENTGLLLTAYRDLITKPGNERQMDLRKENLEIARDLVNQALDRAIGD